MTTGASPDSPSAGQRVGVVVVAAGSSRRMGGTDKTFAPILGTPLVLLCLNQFETWAPVSEIVLVLAADSLEKGRRLIAQQGYRKVSQICAGGERRQDSVRVGLDTLKPCDLVVVHDGARPGPDQALLQRGLKAARECEAVVAGVPIKDTIKVVSSEGTVVDTPPRDTLWAAQTPQIFRYDLLMEAHRQCTANFTDDAAMVESLGHHVQMFLGSYENLKVTTPEDIAVVEAVLKARGG